ncbi:unnamed protein product [Cyprideis torosa]|uniref:Galactokinase n=1 Tax=Cyprideis torosa TaxID=163714 RepID=A0A7R8ZQ93_9CRUS|nr:unnamed protein product [Cyprideis torosa]CAG0891574.1 unnamed protein product [Cyprideis torosa]
MEALISKCKATYEEKWGSSPSVICASPGRVNLIGEHTDYCEGFVFPMAIPLWTVFVGGKSKQKDYRSHLTTLVTLKSEPCSITLVHQQNGSFELLPEQSHMGKFILGVATLFAKKMEIDLPTFSVVVDSSVPLGGGLSSSASFAVGFFTFLEGLTGKKATLDEKALLCQKVEHDFVGTPCGIMDQMICTKAKEGQALFLDCRTLNAVAVPIQDPEVVVLVTNSGVHHELSGSEYPSLRKTCEKVAEQLKKRSLRDVSMQELQTERAKGNISEEDFIRAWHVVTEIARTVDAKRAFESNDMEMFGKLMYSSHNSLQSYGVSCDELDLLVDIARSCPGVYGSRLTGAGFGGCTVTLVHRNDVESLKEAIQMKYSFAKPVFYVCTPVQGAHIVSSE